MKRARFLIASVIAASYPGVIFACGACVEDRIAATYDHRVVIKAIAHDQQVVFVAIDGPGRPGTNRARLMAAAAKVRGVQLATVRTSEAPAAFSFALDAAQEPKTAVSGFQKALGDSKVELSLVRVMRNLP